MIEFIDKTSEQSGTPLNRSNLMAIQGFEGKSLTFKDNSFIIKNDNGETLTIAYDDENNTFTQTFTGEKTITLTTTISVGGITEVLS